MLWAFPALVVKLSLPWRKGFGSIVVLLFWQKRDGANGKSFISVNVGSPGGLGVAIALLLSLTDPLSKIRDQNQIFC